MTGAIFDILALVVLGSAFLAVTQRNLFHCALFFVLSMFGVAGVFLYLDSEFLAAVQVIIYVGAVTVFLFFGIMFTRNVMDGGIRVMNAQFWPALVAALLFGGLAFQALRHSPLPAYAPGRPAQASPAMMTEVPSAAVVVTPEPNGVGALASALMDPAKGFAYAFEFVSILLLSALIGAIVVARKEPS